MVFPILIDKKDIYHETEHNSFVYHEKDIYHETLHPTPAKDSSLSSVMILKLELKVHQNAKGKKRPKSEKEEEAILESAICRANFLGNAKPPEAKLDFPNAI